MSKKVNTAAIGTAAVVLSLAAVIGVLGFKAKDVKKEAVTPSTGYQSEYKTEDVSTEFQTGFTTEFSSSEIPSSIPETSQIPTETAESTTGAGGVTQAITTAQNVITEAVTRVISTTAVRESKTETTTAAASTTKPASTTAASGDVTVPELEDEDLKKGVAPVTYAVSENLPPDMSIVGLYREGYKVWGPKNYIFNDDTAEDCMQRKFGYNVLYDAGANLIDFSIDTARIKFNYGGKAFMIQLWKGQYISGDIGTVGGEVGIYTRDENASSAIGHYNCADKSDWLNMEMTILWDEAGNGNYIPQFTRKYEPHWWLTGYVDGQLKNKRDSSPLRILCRITFKDQTQASAFESSLIKAGFNSVKTFNPTVKDTCKRSDRDVIFVWQDVRT